MTIEDRFVRNCVIFSIVYMGIIIITTTLIAMMEVTDIWTAFTISAILVSATALIAFVIPKKENKMEESKNGTRN